MRAGNGEQEKASEASFLTSRPLRVEVGWGSFRTLGEVTLKVTPKGREVLGKLS